MLVVSAALSTFIAGSASREVESQLQSSGAVYDRLWQARAHELQNAAQLLARDFGFRAAVATGDQATMQSALGNAAARLHVRTAFIVTADGRVSTVRSVDRKQRAALWQPLDAGRLTGVCGARRKAATAGRRADHGADAARLGRVRGRSRSARNARARAAFGHSAPRARARRGAMAAGRIVGQHAGPSSAVRSPRAAIMSGSALRST